MIEKKSKDWFHSGRGDVSAKVAKSGEAIVSQESSESMDIMPQDTSDAGAKPVFATGDMPFHSGRGLGRGHGPDDK